MKVNLNNLPKANKSFWISTYDYLTASIIDEIEEINFILVGDSVANVYLGREQTNSLTLDEMKVFVKAVAGACKNTVVVADLPFEASVSLDRALYGAVELVKLGADAVKIEGASESRLKTIRKLVLEGFTVVGHIGVTPQTVYTIGGFSKKKDENLLELAVALQEAGVKAVVLENVEKELAEKITKELKIRTVGIGAGKKTDDQIIVLADIIGLTKNQPPFAKKKIDMRNLIKKAIIEWREEFL